MNLKIVPVVLFLSIAYFQGLLCESASNVQQAENEINISKRSDIRSLKKGKPGKPLNMKQAGGAGLVAGKNNFKPSRVNNRKGAGKVPQQGQLHKKQKCIPNQPSGIPIECIPNGSGQVPTLYGQSQGQTQIGVSGCQGFNVFPCPPVQPPKQPQPKPPAPKPAPAPQPEKPTLLPYPPPPQQNNPGMVVDNQLPQPEKPTLLPYPPPPNPPSPPPRPQPPPAPVKPAPAPVPCPPTPNVPGGSSGMPPPPSPGMPATLLPAPPVPCVRPSPAAQEIPFGSKGYEYGFGMDVSNGAVQCQQPAYAICKKKCTMNCPKRCCSPHKKIGN